MKFATKRWRAAALALTTGAAATLLAVGPVSRAQAASDGSPWYEPISVKAGLWMPSDAGTRRTLGYSFPAFGISYDIKKTSTAMPNKYEIYLDYFSRSKSRDVVVGDETIRDRAQGQMYAIGVADRIYFSPRSADYRFYAGAGVGIYHVRAEASIGGDKVHEYKTSFGGKFLAGTELSGGVFAQLEYAFIPEPKIDGERFKLSGTQLQLGYRF